MMLLSWQKHLLPGDVVELSDGSRVRIVELVRIDEVGRRMYDVVRVDLGGRENSVD